MSSQWYVIRDGKKRGPFSSAQLKELAGAGRLSPTDSLWREGLSREVQARKVQGLFASEAHPAASAPQDNPPRITGSGPAATPRTQEREGLVAAAREAAGASSAKGGRKSVRRGSAKSGRLGWVLVLLGAAVGGAAAYGYGNAGGVNIYTDISGPEEVGKVTLCGITVFEEKGERHRTGSLASQFAAKAHGGLAGGVALMGGLAGLGAARVIRIRRREQAPSRPSVAGAIVLSGLIAAAFFILAWSS